MENELEQKLVLALSRVYWIGGAADAGKSTVAQKLAERQQLLVYHYDRHDLAHHRQLAKSEPGYQTILDTTLEDKWVRSTPEELFQRALRSFRDRFPLIIKDLLAHPKEGPILVEGFGLLPELLVPLLSNPSQAIWLVPTKEFKRDSMMRRGKPSFGSKVSDPERVKTNLYTRDMLLANYLKEQVSKYGYIIYEVDGSFSADELTDMIERRLRFFTL